MKFENQITKNPNIWFIYFCDNRYNQTFKAVPFRCHKNYTFFFHNGLTTQSVPLILLIYLFTWKVFLCTHVSYMCMLMSSYLKLFFQNKKTLVYLVIKCIGGQQGEKTLNLLQSSRQMKVSGPSLLPAHAMTTKMCI